MKAIFVDTNSINEKGILSINEIVVKNMGLKIGEKVIAYQETDSWDAEIVFDENNWGVVLISSTKEISNERHEGHEEGFWCGYYLQSIRLLRVLQDMNYHDVDIEIIKSKLGIK